MYSLNLHIWWIKSGWHFDYFSLQYRYLDVLYLSTVHKLTKNVRSRKYIHSPLFQFYGESHKAVSLYSKMREGSWKGKWLITVLLTERFFFYLDTFPFVIKNFNVKNILKCSFQRLYYNLCIYMINRSKWLTNMKDRNLCIKIYI